MPIYRYAGKLYKLDETDPEKAIQEIERTIGVAKQDAGGTKIGDVLTGAAATAGRGLQGFAAAATLGPVAAVTQVPFTKGYVDRIMGMMNSGYEHYGYEPDNSEKQLGSEVVQAWFEALPEATQSIFEKATVPAGAIREFYDSMKENRPFDKQRMYQYADIPGAIGNVVGNLLPIERGAAGVNKASGLIESARKPKAPEAAPQLPPEDLKVQQDLQKAQEYAASQGREVTAEDIIFAQEGKLNYEVPDPSTVYPDIVGDTREAFPKGEVYDPISGPLQEGGTAPSRPMPTSLSPDPIIRARQEAAIAAARGEQVPASLTRESAPTALAGAGDAGMNPRTMATPESLRMGALEFPRQEPSVLPGAAEVKPYSPELALKNGDPNVALQQGTQGPYRTPLNPTQGGLELAALPPNAGEGLSLQPSAPRVPRLNPEGSVDLSVNATRGFGGATEMSNLPAGLTADRGLPVTPPEGIPFKPHLRGPAAIESPAPRVGYAPELPKAPEAPKLGAIEPSIDPATGRFNDGSKPRLMGPPADITPPRPDRPTPVGPEAISREGYGITDVLGGTDLNAPRVQEGNLAVEKAAAQMSDISPLYPSEALKNKITLNDARGALDVISTLKHGDVKGMSKPMVKFYNYMAKWLLKDPNFKPTLKVIPFFTDTMLKEANISLEKLGPDGAEVVRGLTTRQGEIILASKWGTDASVYVFMHEAVHARLAKYISMYLAGDKTVWRGMHTAAIRSHIENIDRLYKFAKNHFTAEEMKALANEVDGAAPTEGIGARVYGLTDLQEFLAEGWSNESFMAKLGDLRMSPTGSNGLGRLYASVKDAFVGEISKIFNLNPEGKSVLEALHSETVKLLKAIDENERGLASEKRRDYYNKDAVDWDAKLSEGFSGQPVVNRAQPPEKGLQGKQEYLDSLAGKLSPATLRLTGDTLYNAYKKQWDKDNKPLPNPIGWSRETPEQVLERLYRKDGTRREDDVRTAGVGYTSANAGNSLIRYVYDNISRASNQVDTIFNKLTRGSMSTVDKNRFGLSPNAKVRRVESPDSLKMTQKQVKGKDIENVLNTIMEAGMDTTKLEDPMFLRARGITGPAERYIKALVKFGKDSLEEVNKARKLAGLEPVAYNPKWIMSQVRYGEFHVYQLDPTTNKHEFLQGFKTKAEADSVSAYVNKNRGLKTTVIRADYNPRNMDQVPLDSFFALSKVVTDPATRETIQSAIAEAIQHLGTNKYGLTRDASETVKASSKELIASLGNDKAWEHVNASLDIYARQVAKYAGSSEAKRNITKLMSLNPKLRVDYEHSFDRANSMWENYAGLRKGDWEKAMEKFVQTYSDTLPKTIGRDAIMTLSTLGIRAAVLMLNPVQILASVTQSVYMPARLAQINAREFGDKGSLVYANLKTTKHMWAPSEETLQLYKYGLDHGVVEARYAESLDWQQSESKGVYALKYMTGEKAAAFADTRSRTTAYLMSYEFAKSAGLDHQKALDFAVREATGAMVQYEKWSRMPFFTKDIVTEAMSPLTTFVSSQMFQLALFMKDATFPRYQQERIVKPLMIMMGALVFFAGARGLPGIEDMATIYDAINNWRIKEGHDPMPSSNELWSNLPQVVQYGVPSHLMGVDVHGTFGMGRIAGSFTNALGLAWGNNAMKGFGELATSVDSMTGEQALDLFSKVSPRVVTELIRSYINDAGPLDEQDVRDKNGQLIMKRTEAEQLTTLLLGRNTIKEAEAKADKYDYNNLSASIKAAANQAAQKLAESYRKNQPWPEFVDRVMEQHPEATMSILKQAQKRYQEMDMTLEEKAFNKTNKDATMRQIFEGVYGN
jgi:hypothetical protein